MKKILLSILLAIVIISAGTATALAAGKPAHPGPYQGQFSGFVSGDHNSRAPIALDLTHEDDEITGKVTIGEGLFIDGGVCGSVSVPAAEQMVTGNTAPGHPDQLDTELTFNVSNLKITVELEGHISEDGEKIEAQAKIDLPWLCGRDPVIVGALERDS